MIPFMIPAWTTDGEHAPWDGSDLVSKEDWEQVEESLPVAIPPIPPGGVTPSQNDVQSMLGG